MSFIMINGRKVGPGYKPYIIAEACINHEGNVKIAEDMVFHARAAGADAIKFQYHVLDDEMLVDTPQSENFADSLYDTLDRTNLTLEEHAHLKSLCEKIGIDYLCTPFSFKSADILDEQLNMKAFKIGSGECTNLPLLRHVAAKKQPMIVSTGMTELSEVDTTVQFLKDHTSNGFMLTHCVSIYPTPYERVNLDLIPEYIERYSVPVGLSDHSVNIYTALGAISLGACLIEKHFSLDRTLPGPDHLSSIEPSQLRELVQGCEAVWQAKGSERVIFPEEKEILAWARESVVTTKAISKGTVFSNDNITVKRPSPEEGMIAAAQLDDVIGKTAQSDVPADTQLRWVDVK